MIKTLLVGATIGVIGKILYDGGKLDPYLALAKEKVEEFIPPVEAEHGASKSTH